MYFSKANSALKKLITKRATNYSRLSAIHTDILIKNNFLEISDEIKDSTQPIVALESRISLF
jgi:hypothetical protein